LPDSLSREAIKGKKGKPPEKGLKKKKESWRGKACKKEGRPGRGKEPEQGT